MQEEIIKSLLVMHDYVLKSVDMIVYMIVRFDMTSVRLWFFVKVYTSNSMVNKNCIFILIQRSLAQGFTLKRK